MHSLKRPGRIIFMPLVAVLLLSVFFSCSNSSSKKSFTASLDAIDALIKQGFYEDAVEELKNIEKQAYNSWAQMGLYKRYMKLGENEQAGKYLVSCLAKNPENIELRAVLTDYYLNNRNFDAAVSTGKKLEGSKFGSLYSEAVFSRASESDSLSDDFFSTDFYSQYYDAWTGTESQGWLRNCAVLQLLSGNYEKASGLCPELSRAVEEPYFWSLVMYDASRFGESVYFCEREIENQTVNAEKKSQKKVIKPVVPLSQVYALKSDSYAFLMDPVSSETTRSEYLNSLKKDKNGSRIYFNAEDSSIPVMLTNSAIFAIENGDHEKASELLTECLDNWADYVPALQVYSDFSYQTNLKREENKEQLTLRDYGMATLDMEKYDNRLIIPVTDAIGRVRDSLERTNSPELYILSLDLKYKTDEKLSDVQKTAEVYKMLEQNEKGKSLYPDLIVNFVVRYLIANKMTEDAEDILYKFISEKYNIPLNGDFWKGVVSKIRVINFDQAELLAYFASYRKRSSEALRLYEYCVFETGGYQDEFVVSPVVSDSSCLNLGAVYYGSGNRKRALEYYSSITGRITSPRLKSMVFYRIAKIYLDNEDFLNAKINAEYAVTLDRHNVQAKQLLSQM